MKKYLCMMLFSMFILYLAVSIVIMYFLVSNAQINYMHNQHCMCVRMAILCEALSVNGTEEHLFMIFLFACLLILIMIGVLRMSLCNVLGV